MSMVKVIEIKKKSIHEEYAAVLGKWNNLNTVLEIKMEFKY